MKRAALQFDDGAVLVAQIDETPDAKFRVSCYAQREYRSGIGPDYRSGTEVEEPIYSPPCESREEAQAWVSRQAVARGFPETAIYWE